MLVAVGQKDIVVFSCLLFVVDSIDSYMKDLVLVLEMSYCKDPDDIRYSDRISDFSSFGSVTLRLPHEVTHYK